MKFDYSDDLIPPGLVLPAFVRDLGSTDVAKGKAVIDTGADLSVIPDTMRAELKLKPCGHKLCRGALDQHPQQVPTYFIELSLDAKQFLLLEVLARPRDTLLLGRDVLDGFVLLANGPKGYFEIGNESDDGK